MSPATPDLETYLSQAQANGWVPVWRDVLADTTTVLGAYWKVSHDAEYSFLLESVTGGEQIARYSVIGANPRAVMKAQSDQITWIPENRQEQGEPLRAVKDALGPELDPALAELLPKFCGGAVGLVAYDYVRTIERLPDSTKNDLEFDDVTMLFTDVVVVVDHAKNLFKVIALADGTEAGYQDALAKIEATTARIKGPLPALPSGEFPVHPVTANMEQADYEANVRRAVEYIGEGDIFQVVPSLRFQTPVDAHPLTVYRALRSVNPSPYMFLFRLPELSVVGASPELLVGMQGGTARVRPIAGTRPRGANADEDERLAQDLLADEKERAEHVMLVDLGRNDVGRVSVAGSVMVKDLMVIERYSHVMHIVSEVHGKVQPGMDAVDVFRAAYPAGTVSGAPKVRAMEIIDELEPTRRGLYGGAVGYLSIDGSLDTAIALRTITIRNGTAYVQAGAGVVWDSVPEKEYAECVNKARACLRAIEQAQRGL
jgi:anthranilate synthase component 1